MDVVILTGGLGTRLKGVWDRPKCLIPVGGVTLLHRLFDIITPLHPKTVVLALGHLATEVDAWLAAQRKIGHDLGGAYSHWPWFFQLGCAYENTPLGTAGALRNAVFNTT